jgi:hypothetical protein
MCARHIYANWRKRYTDKKLQKKWWRCAKASCRQLFNLYRAWLAEETPQGAEDMMKTDPQHWSRAFFRVGSNCDSVDNNMCESFNNSIMDARYFPVISMNEAIRKKVMVRIQENRTKSVNWTGTTCPNIFRKLKLNIERSGCCVVLWNGANGFEVQEKEDRKYVVDMTLRTCTCRYWQLSGLPCCHAISCIYKASRKLDDYIAPCYSIDAFRSTYSHVLQPIEGPGSWPISDMPKPDPPAYVKMPGRPKTERRREEWEQPKGTKLSRVGIKMRCRLCGKDDHNARRCPKNPEAGKKVNAHIKRDKAKNKRAAESAQAAASSPKRTKSTSGRVSSPSLSCAFNYLFTVVYNIIFVEIEISNRDQSKSSNFCPFGAKPATKEPGRSKPATKEPGRSKSGTKKGGQPARRGRHAGTSSQTHPPRTGRLGWYLFGDK